MPEPYLKMTTKMGTIFASCYLKNFSELAIEKKG